MNTHCDSTHSSMTALMQRLGVLGFVFFLAKGMLWLIVPALAAILL